MSSTAAPISSARSMLPLIRRPTRPPLPRSIQSPGDFEPRTAATGVAAGWMSNQSLPAGGVRPSAGGGRGETALGVAVGLARQLGLDALTLTIEVAQLALQVRLETGAVLPLELLE